MQDFTSEFEFYMSKGMIDRPGNLICTGKEALVFLTERNDGVQTSLYALKIYKGRNTRSFRHRDDYQYQIIRPTRREARALKKKSDFGKKVEEHLWHGREKDALQILNKAGAHVPQLLAQGPNSLLMTYFGDAQAPAPKLVEIRRDLPNPDGIFREIMNQIELFLSMNIIHGDLSSYNILYASGMFVIIDFPQAVDARTCSTARMLLERDITAVCAFFSRLGVVCDPQLLAFDLWHRYLTNSFGDTIGNMGTDRFIGVKGACL